MNRYEYTVNESLKVLSFDDISDEWLDFVANCRQGVEHNYDIIEGPMADDKIWNFVELFANGRISRSAFFELAKFNNPTHQIVFCNEKSLKCIHFEGSNSL